MRYTAEDISKLSMTEFVAKLANQITVLHEKIDGLHERIVILESRPEPPKQLPDDLYRNTPNPYSR